ncbi:MAG: GyrI-like domain-containing protein [Deltaproteobacteria bacterium]|nr:GyrI-like domain-containing protein [Deltaproteobacteria bacterium]
MEPEVSIVQVAPRLIAAVRRTVAPGKVPAVFGSALDLVWAFLRAHPGLRTDGHNVFLYHHVDEPVGGMPIDFGVEVTRRFEPGGEVRVVETPAGEAAEVVHRGDYAGLPGAHAALHRWCAAKHRRVGAHSLEIYGDWSPDPARLETTIQYLLR